MIHIDKEISLFLKIEFPGIYRQLSCIWPLKKLLR